MPDRRITLRLVRWGEVASADRTVEGIAETFMRGAFDGADPSRIHLESQTHLGSIVGVAESIEQDSIEARAVFRVAATDAGDELLTLVREGVLSAASVVFSPIRDRQRPDGVVERHSVDLKRVAILPRGAYPSSQVIAVRSDGGNEITRSAADAVIRKEGTPTVGDEIITQETQPVPAPAPTPPAPVVQTVDMTPVMERLEAIETDISGIRATASAPAGNAPDIYRHESLAAYARDVFTGEADAMDLARTIADQVTGNNAGVLPPSWVMDVKRIVDLGRRAITAFGGARPIPDSGMAINWPYLGSSNTVIGVQSSQMDEITSARVDISKGEADLVTYAGGSDLSYQIIQRSEPSYQEAYQRILLAEWGKVTDAAFCAALEAAQGTTTQVASGMLGAGKTISTSAHADDIIDATGHGFSIGDAVVFTALSGGTGLTAGRVYWVTPTSFAANTFRVAEEPGGTAVGFTADISSGTVAPVKTTGTGFRTALFQSSVAVEDATGQPASIVLAGTDVFLALAGLTDIVPPTPATNPSNSSGTALASTLRLDASGLTVVRAPGVSLGKFVISNREAAAWYEQGPQFVTAEDVHHLARNVGVYSFAAPAAFVPAGIVEVTLI